MEIIWALCCLLSAGLAQAESVANVAVASNFSAPMKELVRQFEREHSGRVRASFASSGKLYAQIKHGAPFHILLSADEKIPQTLVDNGLAEESFRLTYAIGSLILWAPNGDASNSVQQRLQSGEFNRLALANPKHAPYGRAAVETLKGLNLAATTRRKWITGENIAQAYHFVSSGNADLGFVARSQLSDSDLAQRGDAWIVPSDYHADIKQDAVLLRKGKTNKLAIKFWEYLQTTPALEIIRKYGYDVEDTKLDINGTR